MRRPDLFDRNGKLEKLKRFLPKYSFVLVMSLRRLLPRIVELDVEKVILVWFHAWKSSQIE
ncbi:hypothetical protein [Thermotoga sp. KOL6]|uniref:hypothetical protein n=1 Tax=Thermotoga sp. KOL6 TaxID=126741 RepID=UPI0011AF3C1A|nr:hypothetical protein [Thermotoga sp. KOL6]